MWIAPFLLFWMIGGLLARRRERRARRRLTGLLRYYDHELRRSWEGKRGFLMRSPRWDAVFGLLTLVAWLSAYVSFEQGSVIERAIRTAMLGLGLGAGAVGLWLGWQVDSLILLLEADGLLARLGVSEQRRTRGGGRTPAWVAVMLWLGVAIIYIGFFIYQALAFTVGFGRAVLGDYTAPTASAAPDLMTIGLGLVAVGLTLRARAFVSQLRSAVPAPRVSDTLRHG